MSCLASCLLLQSFDLSLRVRQESLQASTRIECTFIEHVLFVTIEHGTNEPPQRTEGSLEVIPWWIDYGDGLMGWLC